MSTLPGEEACLKEAELDGDEDNITHSHVLTKGVAKENHYGNVTYNI